MNPESLQPPPPSSQLIAFFDELVGPDNTEDPINNKLREQRLEIFKKAVQSFCNKHGENNITELLDIVQKLENLDNTKSPAHDFAQTLSSAILFHEKYGDDAATIILLLGARHYGFENGITFSEADQSVKLDKEGIDNIQHLLDEFNIFL